MPNPPPVDTRAVGGTLPGAGRPKAERPAEVRSLGLADKRHDLNYWRCPVGEADRVASFGGWTMGKLLP